MTVLTEISREEVLIHDTLGPGQRGFRRSLAGGVLSQSLTYYLCDLETFSLSFSTSVSSSIKLKLMESLFPVLVGFKDAGQGFRRPEASAIPFPDCV